MSNKRGVVIVPPFALLPNDEPQIVGNPSPADLRKYLLYWDAIDYPENDCIRIETCPDLEYLIDVNVAKRTHVEFSRPITAKFNEFFLLAQQEAFKRHEKESPGSWSLAQLSTTPHFVGGIPTTSVEYELWNMLPVPTEDVPLAEILEFKAKRQDELVALWIHLDEMYQSIISSADLPRAKNAQLAKLEMDLKAIDRTLAESGVRKTVTSLRGFIATESMNIFGGGTGMIAVADAGIIEMSPLTAGVMGAGAGIAFGISKVLFPIAPKSVQPLTYVSSVKKEVRV